MLHTGECKFSISREVFILWKKLKHEKRENEFLQKFCKTFQGHVVQNMLKLRKMHVINVNIEKRLGDNFEYLYIKVKPL